MAQETNKNYNYTIAMAAYLNPILIQLNEKRKLKVDTFMTKVLLKFRCKNVLVEMYNNYIKQS